MRNFTEEVHEQEFPLEMHHQLNLPFCNPLVDKNGNILRLPRIDDINFPALKFRTAPNFVSEEYELELLDKQNHILTFSELMGQ